MAVAEDDRFKDLDAYFKILIGQYNEFFGSKLSGRTNIKTVLASLYDKLGLKNINRLIYLHNTASADEEYGQRMFDYCTTLVEHGLVPESFPEQFYILSVDWPLDFLVQPMTEESII